MIDPNVPNADHAPSRSTVLDVALQIGLVGFLVYACSRYISPFSDLLIWSAILAVMLYPLHLRLAVRLGNRWSGEPRALGCYYASLASSSGPMSSKIPAGTASMSRMPLPGPTQILIGSARGIPAEENNSSAFTGKM